jgi:hypothetical protein
MADKDRALELARSYNPAEFKMRPMGDIYSDARRAIADKYNAFMGHPVVQAFGEEPWEMTKAVGETGVELAKQVPGAVKAAANYAYENPSKAAGHAVEFAAGMSPNPIAMFLWGPGGFLSPTPANAGEDEQLRQLIQSKKAQGYQYASDEPSMAVDGEVREAHADGRAALPLLAKGESLMTKLAKEALQRRGAQAAQRVERAADEIPNLEHQYTPDALRDALLTNDTLVMTMKPGDFQKFSEKLPPQAGSLPLSEGELPNKFSHRDEYLKYLSQFPVKGGGGFTDVPHLVYGTEYGYGKGPRFASIVGHEGRHRMLALEGLDDPSTLVRLHPTPDLRHIMKSEVQESFPYQNPYNDERMITQFKNKVYESPRVIPEKRALDESNLIDLPEPYAKGGKAG